MSIELEATGDLTFVESTDEASIADPGSRVAGDCGILYVFQSNDAYDPTVSGFTEIVGNSGNSGNVKVTAFVRELTGDSNDLPTVDYGGSRTWIGTLMQVYSGVDFDSSPIDDTDVANSNGSFTLPVLTASNDGSMHIGAWTTQHQFQLAANHDTSFDNERAIGKPGDSFVGGIGWNAVDSGDTAAETFDNTSYLASNSPAIEFILIPAAGAGQDATDDADIDGDAGVTFGHTTARSRDADPAGDAQVTQETVTGRQGVSNTAGEADSVATGLPGRSGSTAPAGDALVTLARSTGRLATVTPTGDAAIAETHTTARSTDIDADGAADVALTITTTIAGAGSVDIDGDAGVTFGHTTARSRDADPAGDAQVAQETVTGRLGLVVVGGAADNDIQTTTAPTRSVSVAGDALVTLSHSTGRLVTVAPTGDAANDETHTTARSTDIDADGAADVALSTLGYNVVDVTNRLSLAATKSGTITATATKSGAISATARLAVQST